MAIEEKVIQPESVTNAEQSVTETPSQTEQSTQPQAPNLDSVKAEYEAKLAAAQKEAAEAQEKFKVQKINLMKFIRKKRNRENKN